jgi:hypothetical protein
MMVYEKIMVIIIAADWQEILRIIKIIQREGKNET